MPIDIKNNLVGGIDLDTSLYYLPPNSYLYALNVTRDSKGGSEDISMTNIPGNRLVANNLPAGTNVTIGAYAFPLRSTIIYFNWNSNGKHQIWEYSNIDRTITKVFQNLTDSDDVDVLGFTRYGKITGVNIFPRTTDDGDLLIFLDSLGRPSCINITRFKNGEYTPVERYILNLNKRPPLSPPTGVYDNDAAHSINNLRNRRFRFQYIWLYDDFEESTPSPISASPVPNKILDPAFTNLSTNNNVITVSLNSGPKNVRGVMLLMSYSEKTNSWVDFGVVDTIIKADESIDDNVDFSYSFYNDGGAPIYDTKKQQQLFSWVPDAAKAQEMPNGNVVALAAITEGLSRDLTPNVTITINTTPAGDGSVIGSLTVVHTHLGSGLFTDKLVFNGIPAVGTVINVYYIQAPGPSTLAGTYTTVAGDTATDVVNGLGASMDAIDVFQEVTEVGSTLFFDAPGTINYDSTEIVAPTTLATVNSIPTWPFSTGRDIALQYYTLEGKTNGVLYRTGLQFPRYTENGSQQVLIPYINAKIYHVPPTWAHSYQWLIGKENTEWLYWETIDVNTNETEYIYFDITNITLNAQKNPTTAAVLNWNFVDGDRVRLIRRMSDNTVFDDTYDAAIVGIVDSPVIQGQPQPDKKFVKIKKVEPFSSVNFSSDFFVIQLYRPGQVETNDTDKTFNEFGAQFAILDPETSDRRHAGEVTDQSVDYVTPAEFNFYEGDAYFRVRTINLTAVGLGSFNILDRNFVDFYQSAVNSLQGRPSLIDIYARETYFSAMIRHGQEYQANTNINGLNLFFPENFDEYDYGAGDIMRLKVRDRYMRVFQKFKVGVVNLFSQINSSPNGGQISVVTDKLLNPIQYYVGDFGIYDAPESLASFNYADYFCDNNRGVICRLSQDGMTDISVKYKVNSWATVELPLRTGDYKIYGAFNQQLNQYIISVNQVGDSQAQTLIFSEDSNTFESFVSYTPEMMCTLGTLLVSFKNGQLYTHDSTIYNNFYNVQYPSIITPVFNKDPMVKKVFNAIAYQSNQVWASPTNGDIETSMVNPQTNQVQVSNLVTSDYERQENVLYAAFWRDANSLDGLLNGDYLNGVYIKTKLVCPAASASGLVSFQLPYINYQISPRNF